MAILYFYWFTYILVLGKILDAINLDKQNYPCYAIFYKEFFYIITVLHSTVVVVTVILRKEGDIGLAPNFC